MIVQHENFPMESQKATKIVLEDKPSFISLKKFDGSWLVDNLEKVELFKNNFTDVSKPHNINNPTISKQVEHHFLLPLQMSLSPKSFSPICRPFYILISQEKLF